MTAWLLIALSFVLILAGFLLPFLMVLGVLETDFTLSFSAYFCSLTGLVLGLYGTFDHVDSRSRDDQ
jgi:hypothetical protein